jgi:hypothetical protein
MILRNVTVDREIIKQQALRYIKAEADAPKQALS